MQSVFIEFREYELFCFASESQDTMQVRLQRLSAQLLDINSEKRFHLTIHRAHALMDAIELMELATEAQMFSPISVHFLGESAADDGGPSREFASLIVQQCLDSYLTQGNSAEYGLFIQSSCSHVLIYHKLLCIKIIFMMCLKLWFCIIQWSLP